MRAALYAVGVCILAMGLIAARPRSSVSADSQEYVHHSTVEPLRRSDWPLVPFRDGRAAFTARVGQTDIGLSVIALMALPGQRFNVSAADLSGQALAVTIEGDSSLVSRSADGVIRWTAPTEEGPTAFRIQPNDGTTPIHINVLVSASRGAIQDGRLNDYPIGQYRARPVTRGPAYEPPGAFAAIPARDEDILASPHFTVGQFLCKEPGSPRYLVLSPKLVHKLEMLLATVRGAGIDTPSLTVMSGYRTPAYNRKIGNTTSLSRHLYGDAADVFVDADGNGRMDDLNGDGKSDVADARYLGRLMEQAMASGGIGAYPGGLSSYRANAVRGPFLHVDTRGTRTRW